MADQALPAEKLPASTRVLAELIVRLLDDRLATAQGSCRLQLEFYDGHLKWLQHSGRAKPDELVDLEAGPTP